MGSNESNETSAGYSVPEYSLQSPCILRTVNSVTVDGTPARTKLYERLDVISAIVLNGVITNYPPTTTDIYGRCMYTTFSRVMSSQEFKRARAKSIPPFSNNDGEQPVTHKTSIVRVDNASDTRTGELGDGQYYIMYYTDSGDVLDGLSDKRAILKIVNSL